jgi:GNAT superfamily N-acetyltransferase
VRPGRRDIAAMVAAFEAAGRLPRLEYLPDTAPAAEPALFAEGFEVELRTTVMTCTPERLAAHPVPAGVTLQALGAHSSLEDVNALQDVQARAFGDEPEPYTRRPRWLGLYVAVLARVDGVPVGGGMSLAISEGTTELVGIGVLEPFRRRGIAVAITEQLARRSFAIGARSAFLTPGDAGATRVYARAGFRETDEMLHLRRPRPAAAGR